MGRQEGNARRQRTRRLDALHSRSPGSFAERLRWWNGLNRGFNSKIHTIKQHRAKKKKIKKIFIPTDFVTSSNPSRRTMPYSTLRQKNQTLGLVVSSFVPFVFHSLNWNHCVPIFSPFFFSKNKQPKKSVDQRQDIYIRIFAALSIHESPRLTL